MFSFSPRLQPVSYASFRHALQSRGAFRVKNKGKATILYDQRNRAIAMLKSASVDAFGRIQPVQYYLCA
ncbi:MAG TPA: hypothetical protein VIN71_00900 [Pseudomonadales bacterium]